MQIRPETTADVPLIRALVCDAFRDDPHRAPGTEPIEHRIVDALRSAGALTLSLVADAGPEIVGHIAISPVGIDPPRGEWYGLGPVAVREDRRREGIGGLLIQEALNRLRQMRGAGVVLVGEPAYYRRFGFRRAPELILPGIPPEYFLCLTFNAAVPSGTVTYHDAFAIV